MERKGISRLGKEAAALEVEALWVEREGRRSFASTKKATCKEMSLRTRGGKI